MADITLFESDIKFIKDKVCAAFTGKLKREKMLLLCSALTVITRARANKTKKGFTVAELTEDNVKGPFACKCMCVGLLGHSEETLKRSGRYLDEIVEDLEALTKIGFLKEENGRYSVVIRKAEGNEVVKAKSSDDAFKKAAEAILSEKIL